MRVAVVGAGMAGLVTAKSLLEQGLEPTIFEASDNVGGLWCFRPEGGALYPTVRTVTSRNVTCFSDFPWPRRYPDYPVAADVQAYLERYARHFGLLPHVRTRMRVSRLLALDDARFRVRAGTDTNEVEEDFAAVVVCSGHHAEPNVPAIPGLESFTGTWLHSSRYRDPTLLRDKDVVVVGLGNTAVDLALEASHAHSRVTLSTRRGSWVVPRYVLGKPATDLPIMPLPWRVEGWSLGLVLAMLGGPTARIGPAPGNPFRAHPLTSSLIGERVHNRSIHLAPAIAEVGPGRRVAFADGSSTTADTLLLCTGYRFAFPFLEPGLQPLTTRMELFDNVFSLAAERLSFVGMADGWGSHLPIAELQARWVAAVLAGKARLPKRDAMRREVERADVARRARWTESHRYLVEVDWRRYAKRLSDRIGARPRWFKNPLLALRYMTSPAIPAKWRLVGPHRWALARDVVRGKDVAATWPVWQDASVATPGGTGH